MLIKIGFDISYEVWAPTPMILTLFVHPSRHHDVREPERLRIEPEVPVEEFIDSFGNRSARIVATARPRAPVVRGRRRRQRAARPDPARRRAALGGRAAAARCCPTSSSSRYCEVDKLTNLAWSLFGQTPLGWSRVQAVCDWVHQHVQFGYSFARSDKSAFDVYNEAKGVCRDFTHLAITLCRGLGIPARYATGYLGDIGVPIAPDPMDFSAWFEVYLGGEWHTFDARHNKRRIGRIVQARGRDATDVALTTTFGKHALRNFFVQTDEVLQPELAEAQAS